MGIVSFTAGVAGQVGVTPRRIQITTTDSLATVTTAGYLNNGISSLANQILPTDIIDMIYLYSTSTNSGTYGEFLPSFSNGVITLTQFLSPGDVTLPVVSGDFAVFDGTTGKIKDAGYSASNAAKTKVVMANGATVANNMATFADTAGTVKDAGARIIATTTGTYAGGGTSNTFTATGLTSAAKGAAVIRTSTNSVSITKALPGTDTLAITFSADPGAGTTVDYIYVTAALS